MLFLVIRVLLTGLASSTASKDQKFIPPRDRVFHSTPTKVAKCMLSHVSFSLFLFQFAIHRCQGRDQAHNERMPPRLHYLTPAFLLFTRYVEHCRLGSYRPYINGVACQFGAQSTVLGNKFKAC